MPLAINIYEDVYFSEPFKVIIRSCKEVLLDSSAEYIITDRSFLYAHRNNFYSFLRGCGFDERLIWTTAFINDILDPGKGFENKTTIRTVTLDDINRIILPLRTIHN